MLHKFQGHRFYNLYQRYYNFLRTARIAPDKMDAIKK